MALRWVMLLVLFFVRLAMGYQFQSVASVSSDLVERLGFSYAEIGTLIGLFLLPGMLISIPSGVMTRAASDKTLLMLGAATMAAGGLVMGLADGPGALYGGRLITGIGGTIFNLILTKMVTEWFFGKEIVTALAIMLTAWPIGIVLGLLTQGPIADTYGWTWAMHATVVVALISLVLTAAVYRAPGHGGRPSDQALRFGLPMREVVHISVVGIGWSLYNASLVIFVSFSPDVLVTHGYGAGEARSVTSLAMWAMLLSIPFGGRVLEVFGWISAAVVVTMTAAAAAMLAISQGSAPEALSVAFGVLFGIPAGALMAMTAEAASPANRGPALGVFFTWYYAGMTGGPALAGWTRDITGSAASPVIAGAAMLVGVILCLGLLRGLQRRWPIETAAAAAISRASRR